MKGHREDQYARFQLVRRVRRGEMQLLREVYGREQVFNAAFSEEIRVLQIRGFVLYLRTTVGCRCNLWWFDIGFLPGTRLVDDKVVANPDYR